MAAHVQTVSIVLKDAGGQPGRSWQDVEVPPLTLMRWDNQKRQKNWGAVEAVFRLGWMYLRDEGEYPGSFEQFLDEARACTMDSQQIGAGEDPTERVTD